MKQFTKWVMIISILILIFGMAYIVVVMNNNIIEGNTGGYLNAAVGATRTFVSTGSTAGYSQLTNGEGVGEKFDASHLPNINSLRAGVNQTDNTFCAAPLIAFNNQIPAGQCCTDAQWNKVKNETGGSFTYLDNNTQRTYNNGIGTIKIMDNYYKCLKDDLTIYKPGRIMGDLTDASLRAQRGEDDDVQNAVLAYVTRSNTKISNYIDTAESTSIWDNASNNLGKGGTLLQVYPIIRTDIAYMNDRVNDKNIVLPQLTLDMSNACANAKLVDPEMSDNITNFVNSVYVRGKELKIDAWNNGKNYSEVIQVISDSANRCIRLPEAQPTLKPLMDKYHSTCARAKQMAIDAGDTIEGGNRINQDEAIQAFSDSMDISINSFKSNLWNYSVPYDTAYDPAIQTAKNANKYCIDQISKYQNWQLELDALEEKPCKAEPNIQLPGSTDVNNSALRNASAIQDILSSLEGRLQVIETNLEQNEKEIGNTKYHDLIIDSAGDQTFDYSLPGTQPVVSIVGSKPQKINFILPMGKIGKQGETGPKGPNFTKTSFGARGPPGEQSHYSGLPEQWN